MTTASIAGEQKDLIEYSQEKTKKISGKAKERETKINKDITTLQSERIVTNLGTLHRKNSSVSFLLEPTFK